MEKRRGSPNAYEQTGDKTQENIRKCTENAVNKRKEEKIP